MPSPFTWDITKPAGTDAINIGDNQIRDDKTTLRDLMRTLVPFGTPTTGWRCVQIDNDIYLVHNAIYGGATWSHDDTAVDAKGFKIPSAGGAVEVVFRGAAASTWATAAWVTGFQVAVAVSTVNYIKVLSSAANGVVEISAQGSDAAIELQLRSKGTDVIDLNTLEINSAGVITVGGGSPFHVFAITDGQLAADNTTRFMPISGVAVPDTTEQNHHIYVLPRNHAVVEMRARVVDAVPGVGKSRTITLRKGGADTAATVTIADAGAAGDWSGSVALVANDLVNLQFAAAGTPAASRVSVVLRMRES